MLDHVLWTNAFIYFCEPQISKFHLYSILETHALSIKCLLNAHFDKWISYDIMHSISKIKFPSIVIEDKFGKIADFENLIDWMFLIWVVYKNASFISWSNYAFAENNKIFWGRSFSCLWTYKVEINCAL